MRREVERSLKDGDEAVLAVARAIRLRPASGVCRRPGSSPRSDSSGGTVLTGDQVPCRAASVRIVAAGQMTIHARQLGPQELGGRRVDTRVWPGRAARSPCCRQALPRSLLRSAIIDADPDHREEPDHHGRHRPEHESCRRRSSWRELVSRAADRVDQGAPSRSSFLRRWLM